MWIYSPFSSISLRPCCSHISSNLGAYVTAETLVHSSLPEAQEVILQLLVADFYFCILLDITARKLQRFPSCNSRKAVTVGEPRLYIQKVIAKLCVLSLLCWIIKAVSLQGTITEHLPHCTAQHTGNFWQSCAEQKCKRVLKGIHAKLLKECYVYLNLYWMSFTWSGKTWVEEYLVEVMLIVV